MSESSAIAVTMAGGLVSDLVHGFPKTYKQAEKEFWNPFQDTESCVYNSTIWYQLSFFFVWAEVSSEGKI